MLSVPFRFIIDPTSLDPFMSTVPVLNTQPFSSKSPPPIKMRSLKRPSLTNFHYVYISSIFELSAPALTFCHHPPPRNGAPYSSILLTNTSAITLYSTSLTLRRIYSPLTVPYLRYCMPSVLKTLVARSPPRISMVSQRSLHS